MLFLDTENGAGREILKAQAVEAVGKHVAGAVPDAKLPFQQLHILIVVVLVDEEVLGNLCAEAAVGFLQEEVVVVVPCGQVLPEGIHDLVRHRAI